MEAGGEAARGIGMVRSGEAGQFGAWEDALGGKWVIKLEMAIWMLVSGSDVPMLAQ